MKAETDTARAQLADLATWARGRSRDAVSVRELYAAQCYEVTAKTIDMALSRLDDAIKAERWNWGEGKR